MEYAAHLFDHLGSMGWIFIGAGVATLAHDNWLVGGLLIFMSILAAFKAHVEECSPE